MSMEGQSFGLAFLFSAKQSSVKVHLMKTLTISVTEQQASLLEAAVSNGKYASDSEIVRDALSLWEQREAGRLQELERLRHEWREGLASGPPVEMDRDAFFAKVKAERATFG